MQKRLMIDLASLPEEGRRFAGELPQEIFDLPEDDAQPVGPLEYDVLAQRFGSELLLTGLLSAPFTDAQWADMQEGRVPPGDL